MSMTMKLRALVIGLLLTLAAPLSAFAQCSGSAPASTYCGNPTGALALPGWKPLSGIPFPSIAGGTVVGNRGTATNAAAAITNPVLGIPGTSSGQLGFAGSAGGTATIVPQATAGSPTLTLPNTSGTFAVGASAPLALSATTGALTCATCVTSSGGGAITGTAPISVSAAGVVSINAPYATLTASNGGIVYSGATNLSILNGTATARQMLQSGLSAAPAWSATTWPATTTINRLLWSSAANVISDLATANGGVLNTSSGGVPSITVAPTLGVQQTTQGSLILANAAAGAFSTTLKSSNSATAAWTLTLPATSGTNLFVLQTDGSGNTSWVAQSGGGSVSPITSSSAQALAVGQNGNTNPAFNIDASTASSVTGINIKSAASGGGVALAAISSATDEVLNIDAKGAANLNIGKIGTGNIFIGGGASAVTFSGGGATFSSATALFFEPLRVTSNSATGFAIGQAGGTNPAFNVDASTTSQVAGLNVKGAVTGGTVALSAIDSGSNTNLSINAKGSGNISVADVSTGHFLLGSLTAQLMGGGPNPQQQIYGAAAVGSLGIVRETTPGAGGALVVMAASNSTPHTGSYSALTSGQGLGSFIFGGDTGASINVQGASIVGVAAGNWSTTSSPGLLLFNTTATGAVGTSEAMRINSSGGVSIGTTTDPGIGSLQINAQEFIPNALSDAGLTDATACLRASTGQVLKGSGTLGICLGTSGAQFKTAFTPMGVGLDEISRLNLLNYRYKPGFGDNGDRVQYGLTAQDVAKVIPDLVRYDGSGEAINFDIGAFLPIALRAIQQLKVNNDNLRQELDAMKRDVYAR